MHTLVALLLCAGCLGRRTRVSINSLMQPQAEPCPQLVAAAPNSNISDITVPYRLARTSHGLGVFALRKIRRGEEVWRYTPSQYVHVTESNWREVVESMIRKRLWKAAPQLDAAYESWWARSGGRGAVPEEMIGLFLRYDANKMMAVLSKDGSYRYMLLGLGDSDYFNYAPSERCSDCIDLVDKVHRGRVDSLLEMGLEPGENSIEPPEAALVRKPPNLALRDIEMCEELLADYIAAGDELPLPDWMQLVLAEHGATFLFSDDSKTAIANIGIHGLPYAE